jgi:hypothetical protein
MDFIIKSYKVPVDRTLKQPSFQEVVLDADNLVKKEEVEIKFSHLIPVEATKINDYNKRQLAMASNDSTIKTITRKVLCKPSKLT